VGMIIPIFVWRSPKGRCHGNQLNLGVDCRCRQERPLLVALAFDNGLADRDAALKRFNGSNPATVIVYKFGELPSNNLGVYAVKTHNFCRDLAGI